MHTRSVGLFGASGYSGLEALRLLVDHPDVDLRFAASDRWDGQPYSTQIESASATVASSRKFVGFEAAEALSDGLHVALLATPTEVSKKLAPRLLARGVKVIDFSGAFRLHDDASARAHYGEATNVGAGVYGLTELYRDAIEDAKLVANPGCYPTSVALALAPLVETGEVLPDSIVVSALSGVSGAGRKATEEYGFVELASDARAYRVLSHQHEPEMAQTLSDLAGAPPSSPITLTFTPHLIPAERGILATCVARLRTPISTSALTELYRARYAKERFITLMDSPDQVRLHRVVGTNQCLLGFATDGNRVIVMAAIDNLIKGAAGQAVQNLNLILGCDERQGLGALRRFFQ